MSDHARLNRVKAPFAKSHQRRTEKTRRSRRALRIERLEQRALLAAAILHDPISPDPSKSWNDGQFDWQQRLDWSAIELRTGWRAASSESSNTAWHHGPTDNYEFVWEPVATESSVPSGDVGDPPGPPPVGPVVIADLPELSSDPGAPVTLFLDVDGHFEPVWGAYSNATTPVYDIDGDETTYNDTELERIYTAWETVAEDMAPFNVNVTTVEPAVLAEGVPIDDANGVALRIAIGGSWQDWYGGSAGGVGYVNAFTSSIANVAYVFSDNTSSLFGNTSSHEAGHALGLSHQSLYDEVGVKLEEYNSGTNDWNPIMGGGTTSLSIAETWYNGTSSAGPTVFQDDMALITRPVNNIDFRADDHGDTIGTASALSFDGSVWSGSGLVETNDDVDVFSFTTVVEEKFRFAVELPYVAPNLDAVLELRDSADNLLATADSADSLEASINQQLPAGDYQLHVTKTADYGLLGTYDVSVETVAPGPFITGISPSGSIQEVSIDTLRVSFEQPIDPTTFDVADVNILGPAGPIAAAAVTAVVGSSDQQFDITIPAQTTPGIYDVSIGVDAANLIRDPAGNPINQDEDAVAGEIVEDQFFSRLTLAAPGWTMQFGGDGEVTGRDVSVGPDGDIYVIGQFAGTVDFDPGPGTVSLTDQGGLDGFVARYSPARELVWVRSLGGADGQDLVRMIDFDAAGNVYVTGFYASSTATFGSFTVTNQGSNDSYVTKLNAAGDFLWVRSWGSTGDDRANSSDVDSNGNIHIVGSFANTVDFDPGPGVVQLTAASAEDGFVSHLDSNGNFVSVHAMSGPERVVARRVAADGAGNVYVAGVFNGTAQFGTSNGVDPVNLTSAGSSDDYLMKLNSLGHTAWIRQAAGSSTVDTAQVKLDSLGAVYFTGHFFDEIDFGPGNPSMTSAGHKDAFITKWDTDGNLLWTGQLSGPDKVGINQLRFDSLGNPHVSGFFRGTADLDPGPGSVQRTSFSGEDGYLLKLAVDGSLQHLQQIEKESTGSFQSVAVSDDGNIYLAGHFTGIAQFPTSDALTSTAGSKDGYLLKLSMTPGISVFPLADLQTTEAGGAAQFSVVLDQAPTSDVTIPVSSSDPSEGTVSVSSLTFTATNWIQPQIVTVTGIDDAVDEGDVAYSVVLGAASSTDLAYDGIDPHDVSVTNVDDDTPILLFADSFENGQWNGLWVEDAQNDWFTSTQRSTDGNSSAEVDGRATDATLTVANPIDLTSYSGAELTFDWYIESGLDGGEYLQLQFFDGSTWQEVARLSGNVDQENAWHSETITVDGAYLVNDFQLRYRAKMNRSNEDANVDNVQLIATSLAGPPNQAPSITSTAVLTATEDLAYSYDVDAIDPDAGDTLMFSLDTAPAGMTIDAISGVIGWTPINAQVGSNSVTVRAEDGGGLSDTQSFSVVVANTNDAPTITSAAVTTANAESSYSYDVDATDPDVDDTLTYTLDVAPAGMTIDSGSGLIAWTPTSGQVGSNSVTVRAEDGGGLFSTQAFSIDVAAVNHAPTINSAAVTMATEDAAYAYDVEATDPGDTLTYSLDVFPSGMTIDSVSGLIGWTPTNSQVGANSVTVRVADQAGGFDTQAFSVTVANTNDAPTITSTAVTTASENSPYSYDVEASDPDASDTLTYSLAVAPVGMTINTGSGVISWTPTTSQVGANSVTVRVDDFAGLFDEQAFTVTVSAAASTKFYVVDDSLDDIFEYTAAGSLEESYNLGAGNNSPKGAAADAAGSDVWVIDNDDHVYVHDTSGMLLRSWKANGLNRPEGIATDGTDVWIVDRGDKRVYFFAGGATQTSDTSATSSFALDGGNGKAKGVTTDGTSLWVVNDDRSTDKVFKYRASDGDLRGSWAIDSDNSKPTGITIDPGNVGDIWVVDSGDDAVYQYSGAATRTSGSQAADAMFNLASGNTNPQGIADPPAVGRVAKEEIAQIAGSQQADFHSDSRSRDPDPPIDAESRSLLKGMAVQHVRSVARARNEYAEIEAIDAALSDRDDDLWAFITTERDGYFASIYRTWLQGVHYRTSPALP